MRHLLFITSFFLFSNSFAQWNEQPQKASTDFNQQFLKAQFDHPELAAKYEFEITKDPQLNEVPYSRLFKAQEQTRQMLSNKAAISNTIWTERGPKDVGGRTRAIMFDPNYNTNNKVWAAGISGGLWYNTNIENNGSWQNIGSFWENIAVSTLAYSTTSPNIFFAGTGEGWVTSSVRGAGVWRSVDSGVNWNRLVSTDNSDFYYIQKIVVSTTGRIICSTNTGLFISDTNGDTWSKKLDGFFGDIEISSDGTIFAAQGKYYIDGTLFRSTDNGNNWTDLAITTDATERIELAIAPSNPNTLYAVASTGRNVSWFKKSIDAGDNWTDISIPMYLDQGCSVSTNDFTRGQAWYDLIMKVQPNDENTVYVGGIDWHKTTDGGSNWTSVSYWTGACADYVHADQHAMVFFPNDNTKSLVGNDGGIYQIENMVSGFTASPPSNNGYNVTQFYGCAMENIAGSNYMLAGAQDNGTQKFTLNGFGNTSQATGGDGGFCFIDQDNSQIQITSYVYNNWRLSTNGGNSFSYYPSTEDGSFINPADYDSEQNILYASSSINTLFVSDIDTDGASGNYLSITNGIEDGNITTVKVSPYSDNVILVGTYGNIFKISNANTNPTAISLDLSDALPYGRISSIDIGTSENQILLSYSSYGVESVWQTLDGGITWTNIEYNLPDMPVRGCLYNPSNTNQILLATETGVWSINDISTETTWEPSNNGLAVVRCDQLKYRDSDKMVAVATYGRGLFTSDVFSDPEPVAAFISDKTISCPSDTVFFTDLSTRFPNQWDWVITPNTYTFLSGTNQNSQNPVIQFNAPGNYSIELTATNGVGTGNIVKTNYIQVNETCHYIMSDDVIYTCEGEFYDSGHLSNYTNGEDYTITFVPSNTNPTAYIKINFLSFDVEYESNCGYDYLKIFDGLDNSAPLIGKYCNSNPPPSEISGSGPLTIEFHSDGGAIGDGWVADITCDITSNIEDKTVRNKIKVYPNPAKSNINIENSSYNGLSKLRIYNLLGKLIHETTFEKSLQINTDKFDSGIYIMEITNKNEVIQQSITIE